MMMWQRLKLVAAVVLVAVVLTAQALSQQAPRWDRAARPPQSRHNRRKSRSGSRWALAALPEPDQRSNHRSHRDFLLPFRPR